MSGHPMNDLFLMERRLAHAFTGLWQINRDPDEFLERMKAKPCYRHMVFLYSLGVHPTNFKNVELKRATVENPLFLAI